MVSPWGTFVVNTGACVVVDTNVGGVSDIQGSVVETIGGTVIVGVIIGDVVVITGGKVDGCGVGFTVDGDELSVSQGVVTSCDGVVTCGDGVVLVVEQGGSALHGAFPMIGEVVVVEIGTFATVVGGVNGMIPCSSRLVNSIIK